MFQAAIPVIFAEVYGYNELEIGLALLPLLDGLISGGIIAGKLVDRDYVKTAWKRNADFDKVKREKLSGEKVSSYSTFAV